MQAKEASEPAQIGVLVHNAGHGKALSVGVTTQQPEIVDNEKGLAVAFSIDSVTLNGGTPLPARLRVQVGPEEGQCCFERGSGGPAGGQKPRGCHGGRLRWRDASTVQRRRQGAHEMITTCLPCQLAAPQVGAIEAGDSALLVWHMHSTLQGYLRPRNVSVTTK